MTRITIKDGAILSHLSKQPDPETAALLITRMTPAGQSLVKQVYKNIKEGIPDNSML